MLQHPKSPAVQCHSLGLVPAAALGKLCPGCSAVTGEGGESPAQQAEEQEVTVSSEILQSSGPPKSCAEKEGNLKVTHRSSGWRLPQEGSLETSGSLEVLSRLHDPATVLLYTTLPKELKRQHGHYIAFVIIVVSYYFDMKHFSLHYQLPSRFDSF